MTDKQRPYITVVSGLPRSGTSMMMRMLDAGGMPVLVDQVRQADDDNPRGYYELEAVKKTKSDASWLTRASGCAVKMVYRLLYDLPDTHTYRVLFMRRRLPEVLASQDKMLARKGDVVEPISEEKFVALFSGELRRIDRWLTAQPHFTVLNVDYNAMIDNPLVQVTAINQFLDGGLDTRRMARVVEPTLYRQRHGG